MTTLWPVNDAALSSSVVLKLRQPSAQAARPPRAFSRLRLGVLIIILSDRLCAAGQSSPARPFNVGPHI